MSAADNKRLVQDILAGLSTGNFEPLVEAMAEDMRWTWMGTMQWSKTFEGKTAVVNELLAAVKSTLTAPFKVVPHTFMLVR